MAAAFALGTLLAACASVLDLPAGLSFPRSDGGGDAGVAGDAGAPAATDQSCWALAADPCLSCCEGRHPDGSAAFFGAVSDCACGPNGKCETECASSDCSTRADAPPSQPGDPCYVCQDRAYTDGGCGASYESACDGGVECLAFVACYDECP
jgi:hypothetical protein